MSVKARTLFSCWRSIGLFGIAWSLPCLRSHYPPTRDQGVPSWRGGPDGTATVSDEPVASEDKGGPKVRKPEVKVRINYVQTSWSKVLNDYAKAVNKQLVADVVPKSLYSHVDLRQHPEKLAPAF